MRAKEREPDAEVAAAALLGERGLDVDFEEQPPVARGVSCIDALVGAAVGSATVRLATVGERRTIDRPIHAPGAVTAGGEEGDERAGE